MDIMMPRLEQQPSPAPWLVRLNRADIPCLIRTALEQNPGASVDEVVAQLARWNVQASGIIVAMWLARWNESAANNQGEVTRTQPRNRELSMPTREPLWAGKT
jgi:hypothetical protein